MEGGWGHEEGLAGPQDSGQPRGDSSDTGAHTGEVTDPSRLNCP